MSGIVWLISSPVAASFEARAILQRQDVGYSRQRSHSTNGQYRLRFATIVNHYCNPSLLRLICVFTSSMQYRIGSSAAMRLAGSDWRARRQNGGSREGRCEVRPGLECGWQLIYERCRELGLLHKLESIAASHDWSTGLDGGPRKAVREDQRISAPHAEPASGAR